MVFSDGVFFDPADRLFKMWYMGGYSQNVCYAVSRDGLAWDKPDLGIVPGTNIALSIGRDSSTVWLDPFEHDPEARFKMGLSRDAALSLYRSRDGIHWIADGQTGWAGDRSTFFYNPFRKVWVFSIRDEIGVGLRNRRYWETRDFFHGARWAKGAPVPWVSTDRLDPRRPEYDVPTQLYNLDAVGEAWMLGLFTIFAASATSAKKPNDRSIQPRRLHRHRPDWRAFIGCPEHMGDWNWANVQSAGVCLIVGDRLHFYVSGRRGVPAPTIQARAWAGHARREGCSPRRRAGSVCFGARMAGGGARSRRVRFGSADRCSSTRTRGRQRAGGGARRRRPDHSSFRRRTAGRGGDA